MAIKLAKPPRVVPNFSNINPINQWIDVPSGSDINSYISSGLASGKRVIQLDPVGTYNGDVQCGNTGYGHDDWAEIRPGDTTLPAIGARIERTSGISLPKIIAQNSTHGVRFSGARRWRLRGLEIRGAPTAGYNDGNGDNTPLIRLCPDPISSVADIPSFLSVRQCLIGGAEETHHGLMNRRIAVLGNATMCEVADSTIFNINMGATGFGGVTYVPQSQSSGAYAAWGKMLFDNCNLWGSTECIAFGGAQQYSGAMTAEQLVLSDLTIRRCHIYRPDSIRGWQGCANGLEWKMGRRVLVEANIIEGGWTELQNGLGIMLWTVNQGNNNPFVQSCDVIVRYNWFKNFAGYIACTANYSTLRGIDATRLWMYQNIGTGTGATGAWRSFEPDPAFTDILLEDNLLINNGGENWCVTSFTPFTRLGLRRNIIGTTYAGSTLFFTSGGTGQTAWDKFNENGDCEFTGNAVLSLSGSGTPNGATNSTYNSLAAMGFADPSKIQSASTKYADLDSLVNTTGAGPNIPLVKAQLAGVEMSSAEYALYAT